MVLRIRKIEENRIFKVYMLMMFSLLIIRYLMMINIPVAAFLLVAMLPIWRGSISEQMAFVASCIPFSAAFQYKYAILILAIAILFKNRWRLKRSGAFILIMLMMIWEIWHAVYGHFSYIEYLRGFAELILLGIVTSIDIEEVDYKLVIRSLAISVVGVCMIMLFMQLQQNAYNIVAVFARSARSFRFGQSNMASGAFALNFNANNLGFICNLSLCGILLLVSRREHRRGDIVLAICSLVFAMMTFSRSAIICSAGVFMAFLFFSEGKAVKKILRGAGGIVIALIALVLIWIYIPSIYENILERFTRADVWNGRGSLFQYYWQFLLSSWKYFLFGIGMQHIFEKISPYYLVHDVPHMGLQEVWVAWGIVGVIMILMLFWKIIERSRYYAGEKRQFYQFMPLVLILVFTMSGQLLTSSRALLALTFSYICLTIGEKNKGISVEIYLEEEHE